MCPPPQSETGKAVWLCETVCKYVGMSQINQQHCRLSSLSTEESCLLEPEVEMRYVLCTMCIHMYQSLKEHVCSDDNYFC